MRREGGTNLLVIRMSALGDVAMTIPAIYSLARQYPDRHIKVLTHSFCARLFLNAPGNVSLITADKADGTFGLIRRLSQEGIDEIADFHNMLRSWLIDAYFLLRGKPIRILRKQRGKRRTLTRRRNKDKTPQRSYTLRYFDVLERLGLPTTPSFTSLFQNVPPPLLPADIPAKGNGVWVGIAPFARYANKVYPLKRMEEAVGLLAAQREYTIFLFGGGEKERRILVEWEGRHPSVVALPGRLSIEQELSLMSRLDVMVSMDSANMHLASLVATPVVSLWGGTTPECGFLGWGQREDNILVAGLPCQPCCISGTEHCPLRNLACMDAITPEDIVSKVKKNINRTQQDEHSHSHR